MRAHVRGYNLQGSFFVEAKQDFHLLKLSLQVQPVAGFGFQRGCAVAERGLRALAGFLQQEFRAGSPGGFQRGGNAPAGGHDFHVTFPLQAHLKLVRAVPCPNQVGVRVHKAGQNGISPGIEQVGFRVLEQQVGRRANR